MAPSHIAKKLAAVVLALWLSVPPLSLAGQSSTTGTVSGQVLSATAEPVPRAIVTLTGLDSGVQSEVLAGPLGRFRFAQVTPGSYELRVEALGFRPLLARTVRLGAGDSESLSLTLALATPPVTAVDTVEVAGSSASRLRDGSARFGPTDIHGLPDLQERLGTVVALAPGFDDNLGARGLPGGMTRIVADGVPVFRAPHPTARFESSPNPLFPRRAISGIRAIDNTADMEWGGSAAGWVSLATRTSVPGSGIEVDAAYSGDLAWSSGELDIDAPSLLSWKAGLSGAIPMQSDVTSLVVTGEALSLETPLAPRITDDLAVELTGLDPEILDPLSMPAVERYRRFGASMRLDVRQGRTSHTFARAAVSAVRRDFDGSGPLEVVPLLGQPEESIDFSLAGGVVGDYSPTVSLELLGGVSGSYRDFVRATGTPRAYLVDSGVRLGDPAGVAGSSSRTDLVLVPLARHRVGGGAIELGAPMRFSAHSQTHAPGTPGDFVFSDPAAVLAGRGYGFTSASDEASFSTRELGLFAQYDAMVSPGLRLALGGRYDFEGIPSDAIESNEDWLAASGLDNGEYPSSLNQLSAGATIEITPPGSPGTRVFATGTVRHGDIDLLSLGQAIGEDVDAVSTRFSGPDVGWPDGTLPGAAARLPAITILGPDTRAPRSTHLTVGLTQRVASVVSLHLRGEVRRTDFLARRRNLNLPITPQAEDEHGRAILGTLAKDGARITAIGSDARRFAGFGEVWALDPDGWSEQRAITVALEHDGSSLALYAGYTRSETTDNWVGAGSGSRDRMSSPGLPASQDDEDWSQGVSDFDAPHRLSASATIRAGRVSLAGIYLLRSGRPFTPGYRVGVDANGDGSGANDVAFVPTDTQLGQLLGDWPCLEDQAGAFAARNSCRGPALHSLSVRFQARLASLGAQQVSLLVDGFNLLEAAGGIIDDALLLVDPGQDIGASSDGSVLTLPVSVNPGFGETLYPTSPGRLIRIGVRIGA